MSGLIDLNLRPDRATLRQFGWIATVGFGFLALIAWQEWLVFAFGLGAAKVWVAGAFAGLALLAGLFSLVWPQANLPIYLGLTVVAFPIGFVLSYLIMGTLFYLLIAPVGLFFRLIGRDAMFRRFSRETDTYWVQSRPPRPAESYFRQF